jgi:hypothetical protein
MLVYIICLLIWHCDTIINSSEKETMLGFAEVSFPIGLKTYEEFGWQTSHWYEIN